ncbi:MAG: hypothetical protein E6G43_00455 [Actinobacteria bacterium]|nr:MAG: hypothetical protein E6G43_00455 [Actinomycetota bacterium]
MRRRVRPSARAGLLHGRRDRGGRRAGQAAGGGRVVTVEVHLVTPEREVWTGDVQMLVAHGTDGMVGILGGHAPLLVQLAIAPLRMQLEDGTWLVAVVDGGRARLEEARARAAADDFLAAAEVAKAEARIVVAG